MRKRSALPRPRRALATTRGGLALLGAAGTIAGGLATTALVFARPYAEPVLHVLLLYAMDRYGRARYAYHAADYWPVTCIIAGATLGWPFVIATLVVRKPGEDRRIDANLRRLHDPTVRGARLDP